MSGEGALARIAAALERLSPPPQPAPDLARAEAFVWGTAPHQLGNVYLVYGQLHVAGSTVPQNVDGKRWSQKKVIYGRGRTLEQFKKLADANKFRGYDGVADGVWTTRRGQQLILLNTTAKPIVAQDVKIPAHEIETKTVP